MSNLLSFKFWVNLRPDALLPIFNNLFIAFIVGLFILAVVSYLLKKHNHKNLYKKLWVSVYLFSFTNIIIGLIILFFNYEMVPFLSARFWFLFWAVEMIIWVYFIIRTLREIPKKQEESKKEEAYKKYIP